MLKSCVSHLFLFVTSSKNPLARFYHVLEFNQDVWSIMSSVADPDPSDPCVLGLLDLDPLVRGTDPDPYQLSSKNSQKNLDSYCSVTPF
jgi:hypothetical protein